MLDEMIQDRVESGQIVRGVRGSVRVVSDRKLEALVEPTTESEGFRGPASGEDSKPVAVEV
jgi:centromeric protein E